MSGLLHRDDPDVLGGCRLDATSPFVLVCDHAGRAIPSQLGCLGLPEHELARHIGWDIGALGVAKTISEQLDAPLLWQNYSRLVVDCNRPLNSPELVAELSEATAIPANQQLDAAARQARIEAIHRPYHAAISALLDSRERAGLATMFISVHSFTPVYLERARSWHLGLLYGEDQRLSRALFSVLAGESDLCVGDNQPYQIDDKDHTLPEHAFKRQLANILLEIRQDLIESPARQRAWGGRLAASLKDALAGLKSA